MADPIDTAIAHLAESISATYINLRLGPPDYGCNDLSQMQAPGPHRFLFPSVLLATGTWQRDDHIRLICMSQESRQTFWDVVSEGLGMLRFMAPDSQKLELDRALPALKRFKTAGVPMETRIVLHHCLPFSSWNIASMARCGISLYTDANSTPPLQAQRLADKRSRIPGSLWHRQQVKEETERFQQAPTGQNLIKVRDAEIVTCRRPGSLWLHHSVVFQSTYACLRRWANAWSLLDKTVATMDAEVLLWMVYRACMTLDMDSGARYTQEDFLRTFFLPENFTGRSDNAAASTASREEFSDSEMGAVNTTGVLLAHKIFGTLDDLHGTTMEQNTGSAARWAICSEEWLMIHETFEITRAILEGDARPIADVLCDLTVKDTYDAFVAASHWFLRIDVECWTTNRQLRDKVLEVTVPDALRTFASGLRLHGGEPCARIRPIWSIGSAPAYIIGIIRMSDEPVNIHLWEKMLGNTIPEHGLIYVHGEDWGSMRVTRCTQEEAGGMVPVETSYSYNEVATTAETTGSRSDRKRADTPGETTNTTKLRTSKEILARLRHHPAHAAIEYEVGYLDRFDGLKWMTLQDWGRKATEEEDFIPEHRIWQFRRKQDDMVVWDRARKYDMT